eukprot:Hpha_TRINITY_DN16246_c1_g3::TRINITY_DN16246_c1_g3_i1::g.13031::m.13031
MLKVVSVFGLVAASASQTLIDSQTPSIFPPGGIFQGEVKDGISITPNGEPEQTKLFYSISACNPAVVSGCSGWHKPKPEEAGVGEHTREVKPGEKVSLSKPGLWFVSAVALTNGLGPSFVENATFRINEPELDAPKFLSLEGKYRSKVLIEIKSSHEIRYTFDGTQPTRDSAKYEKAFEITAPGRHVVKAISVDGEKVSPTRQATFVVSLPVAYEVSTECAECKGPTVDEPFTIMFQGFRSTTKTRVFVSSASTACEIATRGGGVVHTLQGCGCSQSPSNKNGGIVPIDLVWHIHTLDSPHPEIFVCFSDDEGKTWEAIPRASSLPDDVKYSFPLLAPLKPGQAGAGGAGVKVEAFDAPFDWRDHHDQQKSQLTEQIRGMTTPRSARLHERIAQDSQARGLTMVGGILLISVGLFFVYRSSNRGRHRSGAAVNPVAVAEI